MSSNFLLDVRHCEFYLFWRGGVGLWFELSSKQASTAWATPPVHFSLVILVIFWLFIYKLFACVGLTIQSSQSQFPSSRPAGMSHLYLAKFYLFECYLFLNSYKYNVLFYLVNTFILLRVNFPFYYMDKSSLPTGLILSHYEAMPFVFFTKCPVDDEIFPFDRMKTNYSQLCVCSTDCSF
jgi:hypothetical protein